VRRLRYHHVHGHAGWAFAGVVHAAYGDGHGGAAGEIGDGVLGALGVGGMRAFAGSVLQRSKLA